MVSAFFYEGDVVHSDALMHCEFCQLCRVCNGRLRRSLFRRGLWVGHRGGCTRAGERTA